MTEYLPVTNRIAYDIGAHVGETIRQFIEKRAARILAFEPHTENCVKIIERFPDQGNLSVFNYAVGSSIGTGSLSVCTAADSISTMKEFWKRGRFAGFDWDNVQYVSIITLDSFVKDHPKPDFVKIDTEGSEFDVLTGMSFVSDVNFEITGENNQEAIKCINRIEEIGRNNGVKYTYAFSLGNEDWIIEDNMNADEIMLFLIESCEIDERIYGNVCARWK